MQTLVNLFGSTSFTGSTLSAAMAAAQSDVVTLTDNNTARVSEITSLTATVSTKAKTFVQDNPPTAIAVGDLWIDSNDNNKLYRASATGSSNLGSCKGTPLTMVKINGVFSNWSALLQTTRVTFGLIQTIVINNTDGTGPNWV